jgi:bifunctional UDP-N-acetylglucosamine pyrophosphorylase/glucosamine-1-phosphate N-acetyltransferase
MELTVVVLAAGKGTRMASPLPKVLHPVAGVPMIKRVIDAAKAIGAKDLRVVIGHGADLVRRVVEPLGATCVVQENQLGTGDAVKVALQKPPQELTLIVNGDHPLLVGSDLSGLVREFQDKKASIGVLTAIVKTPGSLGRIVRHHGDLRAIVEVSDASAETLRIREVNSGIYIAKSSDLLDVLPKISNQNKKNEFYLTDIVPLSQEAGRRVVAVQGRTAAAFGVNSQSELARATRAQFRRKAKLLMEAGVVMIDPRSVYIEDEVEVGPGSVINPGAYLRGRTRIGACCVVESHAYLANAVVGEATHVKAMSHLENCTIGRGASIGPFARIRPDSNVGDEAHIGNFVELKKAQIGARSKAGHLTYIGDATVGLDVNIGCGTITCNYAVDRKKYQTVIGDRVFVGSDTQFVAPVTIGDDAVIASGSTITEDVPARALAIARERQVNKPDWVPEG